MNIRNNIIDYLFDRNYCICTYDNNVYIYKYKSLEHFSDKIINIKLENKGVSVKGLGLTIVRITKEEILIKGRISSIEMVDSK